ncbi:MAG: hypothetical protein WAT81_03205 [Candidatus Moraniibacteriota bacterium]
MVDLATPELLLEAAQAQGDWTVANRRIPRVIDKILFAIVGCLLGVYVPYCESSSSLELLGRWSDCLARLLILLEHHPGEKLTYGARWEVLKELIEMRLVFLRISAKRPNQLKQLFPDYWWGQNLAGLKPRNARRA